jgi:hypothetical protein
MLEVIQRHGFFSFGERKTPLKSAILKKIKKDKKVVDSHSIE